MKHPLLVADALLFSGNQQSKKYLSPNETLKAESK
jgi:hypothetical protein